MACIRRVEELSTDPDFVGYYDLEEAHKQDYQIVMKLVMMMA